MLNEISNAQIYLKKALKLNNNFPPYMEFYFKLNIARNEKELIKVLKNYWIKNPNPNIEKCIEYAFDKKDSLSKIKTISKILEKNDNLYYKYLILGKFKYKAKIWGSSKNDLKKSIEYKASREAYYYLYKIGIDLKYSNNSSEKLKKLYSNCSDIYFWQCNVCNVLHDSQATFFAIHARHLIV